MHQEGVSLHVDGKLLHLADLLFTYHLIIWYAVVRKKEGTAMITLRMNDRPIIPKTYLSRLNDFSLENEYTKRTNPVCLTIEYDTMTVEDLIDNVDFSSIETSRKRHSY